MQTRQYSRRQMLRTSAMAAGIAVTGLPAFAGDTTADAVLSKTAANLVPPDWIAPGKLRWVWALWEPMALYRRGGMGMGVGDGRATGHWVRRWYDRMHGDEILDKLADAGVNLVTTHFYKGFGLVAEAEEIALATDFTRRAHARGIRVLGYHQFSTVVYETMLDEVPRLRDWVQRTADGGLQTYGSATWRWKACPIHDGFIAYLKRAIDRCLIDADMDGVEYDGTSYECWCPACTEAFREFLAAHNPEPRDRFGIPHFRHVEIPPRYEAKNPIWQEWVRFRMDLMGRRLRELREYVHRKKPGAALVTYEDCPAMWRSDRTRLLPDDGDYLDLGVTENHDAPVVLDGELITKARHLKEGTALGVVTLSTDWPRSASGKITLPTNARSVELDMAECLACGGHVCAATWALRPGKNRDGSVLFEQPEFHAALKRYLGFARDHQRLYAAARPCANVWVYHSRWSLAFDRLTAYNSVVGFEQALLGSIAYRVAKQPHLAQLGPRDVLVVANQTCLADAECTAIREAVGRGCGLIVTAQSGECDENFRQRAQMPLEDLRRDRRVRYFANCPGRIPVSKLSATILPAMPAKAAEILATVRELAAGPLAAELDAGGTKQPLALVDVYQQPDACVTHVIDYAESRSAAIRLRLAPWLAAGKAVLHAPALKTPVSLDAKPGEWMTLPKDFGVYAAIKIDRTA